MSLLSFYLNVTENKTERNEQNKKPFNGSGTNTERTEAERTRTTPRQTTPRPHPHTRQATNRTRHTGRRLQSFWEVTSTNTNEHNTHDTNRTRPQHEHQPRTQHAATNGRHDHGRPQDTRRAAQAPTQKDNRHEAPQPARRTTPAGQPPTTTRQPTAQVKHPERRKQAQEGSTNHGTRHTIQDTTQPRKAACTTQAAGAPDKSQTRPRPPQTGRQHRQGRHTPTATHAAPRPRPHQGREGKRRSDTAGQP